MLFGKLIKSLEDLTFTSACDNEGGSVASQDDAFANMCSDVSISDSHSLHVSLSVWPIFEVVWNWVMSSEESYSVRSCVGSKSFLAFLGE